MDRVVSNYYECLKKLYSLYSLKSGIDNSLKLSEGYDHPCDKYKTIHVTGTNGKGSVCYKIYSCLKLKKYKVGLFTSPHISSLRERIVVDDELISEEDLIYLVNNVIKKTNQMNIKPSFFEIITMIAYLHFLNKKVQYAVIETGIGGRLDATNILTNPYITVITSIGYDHLNILGNDLNSICKEKIGIFKKNTNIVIGPSVSIYKIVFEKAKELNCVIKAVPPEPRGETYNEENTRIALEVLKVLNIHIDQFLNHIANIKPPLRLQYLAQEQIDYIKTKFVPNHLEQKLPLSPHAIILDVGHNETAIDRLCRDINYFHKDKLIRICISLTKPRDFNIFNHFVTHFHNVLKDVFYLPALDPRIYDFEEAINVIKNDNKMDDKLKQLILDSSEKVSQWIASDNDESVNDPEKNKLYKRECISLIVKNVFIECCKDNSILLISGTFYIFNEILNILEIYSEAQDPDVYYYSPKI